MAHPEQREIETTRSDPVDLEARPGLDNGPPPSVDPNGRPPDPPDPRATPATAADGIGDNDAGPALGGPPIIATWQAELRNHFARTEAAVADLAERVSAESARAAARERVIDRQHDEIERLRATQRSNQLRPTVTDLYRLRNDLLRQASTVPAEMTGADVAKFLRSYADTVEEALERCGVTVSRNEVGAVFVAGRHQVARTVDVDDPRKDATIAAVVQDGYEEIDGTVVAPARIALNRSVVQDAVADTGEPTKESTDD